MKPSYTANYIDYNLLPTLISEVSWLEETPVRKECFMSLVPLTYTYGSGRGVREYKSVDFHPAIASVMRKINDERGCDYNICFLNLYINETNHLGWHADDSPEMDPNHPIAVVSFGEVRPIWWRLFGQKGEIPPENRQMLEPGSLFVMPPGFQQKYEHRIPKGSRQNMEPRVSLTFRRYF